MSRTSLALVPLLAIAALACSSSSPLAPDASGAAGHPAAGTGGTGDAGTTGAAGTGEAGGGAAGTTDASVTGEAGTTGAAGATDAAAGTTGATDTAADTTGAAGTSGTAGTTTDAAIDSSDVPSPLDVGPFRPDAQSDGATLPSGQCVAGAFRFNGGPCTCQLDVPIVCGAGCTDTTVDDDNCGTCGNKCGANATCQRGTCGPPPLTIVPSAAGCQAIGVAVSGNQLFWTDKGHNKVSSMPAAGGAITNLSLVASAPTAIAATGVTAFWLESGARAIRRSPPGGPVATVVTSTTDISNFTLSEDGSTVFFSTGTTVMKVLAGGGAVVPVVSEDHGGLPGGLAVKGSFIAYPTGQNGDVDIAKLTPGLVTSCGKNDPLGELLPNPNCNRVARSQGALSLEVILIRNDRVFWLDGVNLKANDMFTGVQENDNIAQTNGNILGLAATASAFYFGDDGGIVYKSPGVKDTVPLRIARGQTSPRSFAVDATRVYWSTGDCTINATGL